jgi:dTDP-4-amino-4,6-dideoxygalactose transaminase
MVPFVDLRRRVESIRPAMEARLARVAVASGTDALWLTLEALGVGPGDEVITVSNTCVPTVAAIVQSGATPVLVDVDPGTLTIDPELVEASLTNRTRCILPVHLYGQCADMDPLRQLAESRGVFLVEDCAQAHGAAYRGKPAGSLGHAGCFSFYPTKNLGGLGDGGMVVTDDSDLACKLRLLRNYGYDEPNRSVTKGYNSRLDELQAAILLVGLAELDGWNERRRSIASTYASALSDTNVAPPIEAEYARHIYHLYVVRAHERERLRAQLRAMGVETMIHYPVPVHRQEGYAKLCRVGQGGLERTERISSEILSLPIFPELREEEVQTVIEAVTMSGMR